MAAKTIGKLRHRITFQSLSNTPDGQGGFTESWVDGSTVWAEVVPKTINERLFAQRIEPMGSHKITIRWLDNINESMRIKFGTRYFQIKSIDKEDERRFFMFIDSLENTGT